MTKEFASWRRRARDFGLEFIRALFVDLARRNCRDDPSTKGCAPGDRRLAKARNGKACRRQPVESELGRRAQIA